MRFSRRAVGGVGAAILVTSVMAAVQPAGAVGAGDDCATRQAKLDAATAGTTVTLTGICTGTFTLPAGVEFNLQGDSSDGADGIDGPGTGTGPLLSGTNIGATTIRDLVFRNGSFAGNGAGLSITGTSVPQLTNLVFESNTASDGEGGGLFLVSTDASGTTSLSGLTFTGNTASGTGGGALVALGGEGPTTTAVTLTGSTFSGNEAQFSGAGALFSLGAGNTAAIDSNVFSGNTVIETDVEAVGHYGGGLYIEQNGTPSNNPSVTQSHNTFTGNTVEPLNILCEGSPCGNGDVGGGGEWIDGAPTLSRYDTFINNTVTNGPDGEVEGGGIGLVGSTNGTRLQLQNAVVAGNSLDNDGGPGSGGGVYVGCVPCNEVLTMYDTTVAGNTVVSPIIAPGVGGGAEESDDLTAVNSIVEGNSGGSGPDIAGFTGGTTLTYTDACTAEDAPYPGEGNICADPLLVDATPDTADVHQTASSPTIDRGSNALVPPEIATDMDDDARIMGAAVDMGADEFVPATTEEPTPGDGVTPPGSIGENDGYCLAGGDSGVFTFGNCGFAGTAATSGTVNAPRGTVLNAPIVGIAMTPDDKGYWMAGADGGVFSFGTAQFKGSLGGMTLTHPIAGIAATPTGNGYWLVATNGAVFAFGDAQGKGSASALPLNKPIVAMAATPSGNGYWLAAADGGVFSFGDAPFFGSMGGKPLNQPVTGISVRPGGNGYWLVATDGGVFSFGDAPFFGSFGGKPLNQPIVAMKSAATGNGYWLVASDGGVFTFGSAPFKGSMGSTQLNYPIVDMTG